MRKLVAVIAVLALVSVAGAAEQVWFVATGPGITQNGAPGVSTNIAVPGGAGSWNIDVYMASEAVLGGVVGYDIYLSGGSTAQGSAPVWSGPAGWTIMQHTVGAGASLLGDAEINFGGVGLVTAGLKVASFTLATTGPTSIIAGSNYSGWGFQDFDETNPVPFVAFGANAPVEGSGGIWAPNAVINIAIPEPATLVLLGLGLVGLLRRR